MRIVQILTDYFLAVVQIRTGGLQRIVLAGSGRQHEGSTFLPAGPHPGAHAALSRDGSPRLTHTPPPLVFFSLSKRRAILSCTYYRIVTRGFTRANATAAVAVVAVVVDALSARPDLYNRNFSNDTRDYCMK